MRGALLIFVLGACARGGSISSDEGDGWQGDAAVADARPGEASPDARPLPAPPPLPPDACVPMTTQLLVNPALDLTPQGAGWTEQIIKPGYPLITPQDNAGGPSEHTAPYKIWLGGITGSNVSDILYQDVAIPPATKALVLTGVHDVRSDETGGIAYDTARVSLTQPNGTEIAAILELSNLTKRAAWTPFQHAFTQDLSGQTVRLRFTSRNDSTRPTSFYFDTLALTATHGCP